MSEDLWFESNLPCLSMMAQNKVFIFQAKKKKRAQALSSDEDEEEDDEEKAREEMKGFIAVSLIKKIHEQVLLLLPSFYDLKSLLCRQALHELSSNFSSVFFILIKLLRLLNVLIPSSPMINKSQ